MSTHEEIERKLVKQAVLVVKMRRRQALWSELEPALGKMGQIVKQLEKTEKEDTVDGGKANNRTANKRRASGDRTKATKARGG